MSGSVFLHSSFRSITLMPFTTDQFFSVFARYNEAVAPA